MISVVVPVYNVKMYLQRCISSLLNQTYEDFEIILVDDGSNDGSSELCDMLEDKKKVIAYHKENGGLASARNYGVQRASGEWITFVDSDDFVSEKYLEDLYFLVSNYNADMAITRLVLQSEETVNVYKKKKFENFVVDKEQAFYEVYIGDKVGWSGCGKLIKRSTLLKSPFVDGFYEDSASAYLFLDDCNRVAIGDYSNNYHYIRREGSITASKLTEKHYRIFEVCEEIENYVNERFPSQQYYSIMIYQNAVLQLLNRLTMPWDSYKQIYKRYQTKFRKYIWTILFKKKISIKSKYYILCLCLTPQIFYIQNKIIIKLKRR